MLIRNIWAVGRNYSDHAKELGNSVPKEPMIFLKAGSSIVLEKEEIVFPAFSSELHHEIEVALQFDSKLNFSKMGLAIDFTARDVQNRLKSAGHPWTLAKSFKHACALSEMVPIHDPSEIKNLRFSFKINGELRQKGNTNEMVFGPEFLAEYVKNHFPVVEGDLLLTGTPSGVGPVKKGDLLEAEIEGKL